MNEIGGGVVFEALNTALTAAGGAVALVLIVLIALGINAMTLLFFGSAVVALERFGRASQRWRSWWICGALWALLLGGFSLYWQPEAVAEGSMGSRLELWALGSAAAAAGVVVFGGLCMVLFRWISPRQLGASVMALLGLATALILGALGQPLYAVAPLVVSVGAFLWARRRRSRRGDSEVSEAESMLKALSFGLAPAALIALAVSEPTAQIASAGTALFSGLLMVVVFGLIPLAVSGIVDSRGRAEWFIAVRYLVAKRRQTFISIITGICVVGIAAGVWLIITVLSVMNGFERTWRDEIIGNRAHFTVHSGLGPIEDYEMVVSAVEKSEGVTAASPYLDAEGMVRGEGGEIVAVRVRGIDPVRVSGVTDLEADLVDGSLDSLLPGAADAKDPAILIGSRLARTLGVAVGDDMVLISPFGGPKTPLGPAPRLARFRVSGIFESSFFQYDELFTYVNLAAAQDFKRVGDVVDGIEARTTDFYRSQTVGDRVRMGLGFPYFTRDWKEFFPAFFQALKTERVMMFILLTMVMVVAAFSIVSTLVMMIMEKSGDIAILKTMGAEDASIERIFALEGTLIGLVGTGLGVVAGISVTVHIAVIQRIVERVLGIDALPASVYQFSTLPAQLDAGQIVLAVGVAMVLALGATLLPSRQAARLDPVESLRYE